MLTFQMTYNACGLNKKKALLDCLLVRDTDLNEKFLSCIYLMGKENM